VNTSTSVENRGTRGSVQLSEDQRSQIKTFNIAPTWTHLFGSSTLLIAGAFARRDH
jgi:hypothetical protein